MKPSNKDHLAHILWIGGASDSGKSTVANALAQRHNLAVFHYDREDARQVDLLAQSVPEFRTFLDMSLEERWVLTSPQKMFEFLLLSFPHRFSLVVEALLSQPEDRTLLVEGFGLLPELVQPVLSSPYQAIWLVPTAQFKWESMTRRGKPSFSASLSDPAKAKQNIFTRDMLLADYYRRQALSMGYVLVEVDGSHSVDEMTDVCEAHFARYEKLNWGTRTPPDSQNLVDNCGGIAATIIPK